MLRSLHIRDVGPAARFDLELGERLNVLTGDNGLGKSFLLEVAWWALTGTWTDRPVLPQRGKEESAELAGEMEADVAEVASFQCKFRRAAQQWQDRFGREASVPYVPARGQDYDVPLWLIALVPVLYVRTNGDVSVWDPARNRIHTLEGWPRVTALQPYMFTERKLWDGLKVEERTVCNGLIQDWIAWQFEADRESATDHPFHLLRRVLEQLSHPDEPMIPGRPVQPYLDDSRRLPTIDLPYETGVPITNASAGMKRIISLAYLIVWAWTEHLRAARLSGSPPSSRLVMLFEEPETHLHPRWQRHIIPALLRVLSGLAQEMKPQVLLTTHAPLVLASLEPHFDTARDKLFSFELKDRREVVLEELPWTRYGDAVGWLTSPVFDLPEARSPEAERAIAAAYDFMAGRQDRLPDELRTGDAIHAALQRLLADQDPFWPQWLFARKRDQG